MNDERSTIKQAISGDETAFEQLVVRYQAQVYNLCLRMLCNCDDAADVTQEVFFKAWRNLQGFHFEAAFSTWLYRLTSNACLDHLRAAKRRKGISLHITQPGGEEQALDIPDPAPNPEERLLRRDERETLASCMNSLDEEHRQILTLRVINDLSYTDIARVLGIKEGTVKSRLARARICLRKKMLQTGNKAFTTASKEVEQEVRT
ncbi:MAG: sigma-70 family RNA polymerase sigma factor [Oscillospiraceae bacterium]|jgi:RNA polymerase sigma-70 factor (ECF subfamily)|nr:sigma-70 family RNA polymerase sigma factor [Oscillospiraceae bacterium]